MLERHGYLGGMGTASLVHAFCGLYLLREEPGAVLANPGFATEMARRDDTVMDQSLSFTALCRSINITTRHSKPLAPW